MTNDYEQCFHTEQYFFLTTISQNSILIYFLALPNRPYNFKMVPNNFEPS